MTGEINSKIIQNEIFKSGLSITKWCKEKHVGYVSLHNSLKQGRCTTRLAKKISEAIGKPIEYFMAECNCESDNSKPDNVGAEVAISNDVTLVDSEHTEVSEGEGF